jgi:hypothetical protein
MDTASPNRYRSLTDFYLADGRRAASGQCELGMWWRDGATGPIHRAAWLRDTEEVYVQCLGPARDGAGQVEVLGKVSDRAELERVLRGWRTVCRRPDSMRWLRLRLAGSAPAPPAGSAHDLPGLGNWRRRHLHAKGLAAIVALSALLAPGVLALVVEVVP